MKFKLSIKYKFHHLKYYVVNFGRRVDTDPKPEFNFASGERGSNCVYLKELLKKGLNPRYFVFQQSFGVSVEPPRDRTCLLESFVKLETRVTCIFDW